MSMSWQNRCFTWVFLILLHGSWSKQTNVRRTLCRPSFQQSQHPRLISFLVARSHGLTPFSVYQGRWNAAFRDMEAEIIPMCEDQGMAIVPWAALGGGQFLSAKQREANEKDPHARKGYGLNEADIKVSEVMEQMAERKGTTLQAIVSSTRNTQSIWRLLKL